MTVPLWAPHDSRIAAGHTGYLLAICGRLSSPAWRFAVPVISLLPGRSTALLRMPAGFVSRGYAVPLSVSRRHLRHVCAVHPHASCATERTFDLPGPA